MYYSNATVQIIVRNLFFLTTLWLSCCNDIVPRPLMRIRRLYKNIFSYGNWNRKERKRWLNNGRNRRRKRNARACGGGGGVGVMRYGASYHRVPTRPTTRWSRRETGRTCPNVFIFFFIIPRVFYYYYYFNRNYNRATGRPLTCPIIIPTRPSPPRRVFTERAEI